MTKTKIFYSLVAAAVALLLAGYAAFYAIVADLPYVPDDLRNLVYAKPTELYAADGSLVYTLEGQSYVTLDNISPHFRHAVIAVEDGDFWHHHGIDLKSNLRAFYNTLVYGRRLGGASTISQQLAKNLFFSPRREMLRKIKDGLLAMQLETMFSKEEILEAYCNLVYFGGTAYGVEDAARQFFDKSARDLDAGEAALLAGILNSPVSLNPFAHPERARQRQQLVLARMHDEGYIDAAQLAAEREANVEFVQRRDRGNDFIDYVLDLAEQKYGREAVYFGGLKIYTTLDPDLQRLAERELATGLRRLETELDSADVPLQGAMAVIAVPTGEVKALVGGRRHVPGGFNRATSANRHIGSAVKPFVYYTALEKLSLQPYSVKIDSLITYRLANGQSYRPRNFDRVYRGPVTLKYALAHSLNSVAVQLGYELTPAAISETLRRCGVSSELDDVLSLALGTSGIAPVELAAAYATLARNGIYYEPVYIKRVEDLNGIVIDRGPLPLGKERLNPQMAFQVLDMMRAVIDAGTAAGAVRGNGFAAPAAGKTGTSYDYTDAWFNGVTTSLATTVWVGYDRKRQLNRRGGSGVTGGYAAAPIWTSFMKAASQRYPAREFQIPEGLRRIFVDPQHGWQAHPDFDGMPVFVPENDRPPGRAITAPPDRMRNLPEQLRRVPERRRRSGG